MTFGPLHPPTRQPRPIASRTLESPSSPLAAEPNRPYGRPRQAAVFSCSDSGEDRFHLRDLARLRLHDPFAEREDFRVGEISLLAHEDRAGMVRDHRTQELLVADKGLLAR